MFQLRRTWLACGMTLLGVACRGDLAEPASNPLPSLFGTVPDTLIAGSQTRLLVITGSGFTRGSRSRVNGQDRTTTFRSASELMVSLLAADVDSAFPLLLTVVSPAPGGGTSGVLPVAVVRPGAFVRTVEPATLLRGTGDTTLVVRGSGFTPITQVTADSASFVETVFVSDSVLRIRPGTELWASAGVRRFRAFNPPPSRAASGSAVVTVENPRPVLSSVAPDSVSSDADFVKLTVRGARFVESSTVSWNGAPRLTKFVDTSLLEVRLSGSDLRVPGENLVVVVTAGPGGGSTQARSLIVYPAPVRVSSVSPAAIIAGAQSINLQIVGRNFAPGTSVSVGATALSTAVVSSSRIVVDLTAPFLARPTTLRLHIASPGFSPTTVSVPVLPATYSITRDTTVSVVAGALLVDPSGSRLFALARPDDPRYHGTVVIIDPATASVVGTLVPPTAPGTLAISDDGRYLYVGLAASPRVTRFDLTTGVADLEIALIGNVPASMLLTLAGRPRSLAVAQYDGGPAVAVYDDGVRRSLTVPDYIRVAHLFRGPTSSVLYGLGQHYDALLRFFVDSSGVEWSRGSADLDATGVHEDNGRLVTLTEVFDLDRRVTIGRLSAPGGIMTTRSVSADGRIYAIGAAPTLYAFSYFTTSLLGFVTHPSLAGCTNLVRWGRAGLACTQSGRIRLFESNLVGLP